MVKTEFAFLRWLRSLATAELPGSNVGAAALAAARGGGEQENEMECELVRQARGVVHVMAGHARTSVARGCTVRRPATGGAMRLLFSETGRHCSSPETSIQ